MDFLREFREKMLPKLQTFSELEINFSMWI